MKNPSAFKLLLGVSVLACSVPAAAQSVPATAGAPQSDPAAGGADTDIAEIVVTAQKRAQSINDVGMSISAFSGDQLTTQGVKNIGDLTKIVPGFSVSNTVLFFGAPVYTLRGIGFFEGSLASTPAVSVYSDELPLPYSHMTVGANLDVQRVEVLKGPQGTLYGQNSTGGAINFIANKPTRDFQAGFDVSIGRFMDTDVQGYVSGPISDTMAARLAVRTEQSDDWQYSVTRNETRGQKHLLMGRFLLDWDPSDRFHAELNLNGWRDQSDTPAVQASAISVFAPAFVQPAVQSSVVSPPNNRAADWAPGFPKDKDNSFYQIGLRATYELASNIDLISVTAYSKTHIDQWVDSGGLQAQVGVGQQTGFQRSFSQELRVQGDTGRLHWVLGGNYMFDRVNDELFTYTKEASITNSFPGFPVWTGDQFGNQTARTWAVYGDAEYRILPTVRIQAGLRYTSQNRDFVGCGRDSGLGNSFGGLFGFLFTIVRGVPTVIPPGGCYTLGPPPGLVPGLVSKSLDEDNVSWHVDANWHPTRDSLVYARVARGYKSGSFPNLAATSDAQLTAATQESVLEYEVGTKLSMFNRALQFDGALFYYDYTDRQDQGQIPDPVFVALRKLVNVPKSRIQGAEFQIAATPIHGLSLRLAGAYIDTKYTSDFMVTVIDVPAPRDVKGQSFPLTPKWSLSGGFVYDTPVTDRVNAFVGSDVNYQGKTFGSNSLTPLYNIPAYTLIDANIGIHSVDNAWRATLWARNITNKYYWTSAGYNSDAYIRGGGMPRTYGASFSYRF